MGRTPATGGRIQTLGEGEKGRLLIAVSQATVVFCILTSSQCSTPPKRKDLATNRISGFPIYVGSRAIPVGMGRERESPQWGIRTISLVLTFPRTVQYWQKRVGLGIDYRTKRISRGNNTMSRCRCLDSRLRRRLIQRRNGNFGMENDETTDLDQKGDEGVLHARGADDAEHLAPVGQGDLVRLPVHAAEVLEDEEDL